MIHGDVLGERARLTPEKTALVDLASGRRLTYGELDRRAALMGRVFLESLGLEKGDRVGLLAHNRVEFLDVFFAAGKSGVVVVPLSTRLTARELAPIVEDSGMTALIYDGELAPAVRALLPLVSLPAWVSLDEPIEGSSPSHLRLADLLAAVDRGRAPRLPVCGPEDTYALLYTSGTTGRPKGVVIPHRMVAWNAYNTAVSWQLREDDVTSIFTPLYHAGGLGAFLLPILAIGGTVVLHRSFEVAEVVRTLEDERCTVGLGVPTIYRLLLAAPELTRVDLSRLRWLISGGAPLPPYLVTEYQRRGVVLKQGYGMTEVGVNCFSMTAEESLRKAGAIGRPMMFTEARLLTEDGREAAPGEVGELLLRGPHVCNGYWRNPEATAAALDAAGWFHTGDLARRDEEGFYTIAGRRKDMFISGGVNVYPAEVEGELLLHPAVKEAAVVGVPDPKWGEVGVAFVVLRDQGVASSEDLVAFLLERLARYKVPKDFVFVPSLPLTPYGKVVKGELREGYVKARGGL